MKKHSCGAILYTIRNGNVCIVLGMEGSEWFPFKGIRERGETNIQAALREIKEETCDAVNIKHIELKCNYSTKRKHYHIGLARITSSEFNRFFHNRDTMLKDYQSKLTDYNWAYLEKNDIKMFPIDNIRNQKFHEITDIPIRHYYKYLVRLQRVIRKGILHKSDILQTAKLNLNLCHYNSVDIRNTKALSILM
jgi:ADP-ribose pyrophosphatase YjhB (NUDIX family)